MQIQVTRKKQLRSVALAIGAAAMTVGGFAMAEGEGSEIPGMITAALVTIGLIGGAVLSVYASIKIFKLVRAAL